MSITKTIVPRRTAVTPEYHDFVVPDDDMKKIIANGIGAPDHIAEMSISYNPTSKIWKISCRLPEGGTIT
jgi:hypothetical protein